MHREVFSSTLSPLGQPNIDVVPHLPFFDLAPSRLDPFVELHRHQYSDFLP